MRAIIRLATASDGEALAHIYRPAVSESSISFELVAPDADEMTRRVERVLPRTPWLVCERGGEVVGYTYACAHRDRPAYQWSVDVSAYVRTDQHRTGVARALYTSLFAILVRQGFYNAYAGITVPNEASVGFHTSMGFESIGVYRGVGFKQGTWHDVEWFEKELAPKNRRPNHPVSLSTLLQTAELEPSLAVGQQLLRALLV